MSNSRRSSSPRNGGDRGSSVPLSAAYPVNSVLELTLSPTNETVRGLVYCTDETSQSIVLRKSLNYTTLASEIRVINARCVKGKKVIMAEAPKSRADGAGATDDTEIALPLPNVTKKAIDEREKRAIMLAQDSVKHINQKVSNDTPYLYIIDVCLRVDL